VQTVHATEVFGIIRSLATCRLTGGNRDYIVIGSDSGKIVILEYSADKQCFDRVHAETYGKTGVRRIVPGQYVAADPRGRAVMIGAVEKQKLVYILNRDSAARLTISSPLEAHKSATVCFDLIGVDVGFDNPIFAALEVDTEEVENELLAWESAEGADIKNAGRIEFRDGPPGRGTEVTATIAVDFAWNVVSDGTNIWVGSPANGFGRSGTVTRIDPATNTVTATIPVDDVYDMASDGTNIWVTSGSSGTVSRIDPATNTVTATIPVGTFVTGVESDGTNIWVSDVDSNTVSRINPATNTVTATITVGSLPYGVASDGTNIWVANAGSADPGSGTVSRIDPATNTVSATIAVGDVPYGVASDGTNIWVTNSSSGTVSRIRA
jgi:YVTN family beta-propeller protein